MSLLSVSLYQGGWFSVDLHHHNLFSLDPRKKQKDVCLIPSETGANSTIIYLRLSFSKTEKVRGGRWKERGKRERQKRRERKKEKERKKERKCSQRIGKQ